MKGKVTDCHMGDDSVREIEEGARKVLDVLGYHFKPNPDMPKELHYTNGHNKHVYFGEVNDPDKRTFVAYQTKKGDIDVMYFDGKESTEIGNFMKNRGRDG